MASVANDPNGLKRILFVDANGLRRTIRLGHVDHKAATAVRVRIERLAAALLVGHPADDETIRWVDGLEDTLHRKLAAVGLVKPRDSLRLGLWLDKFLEGRADLKPSSLRKMKQTHSKLLAFFPEKTSLRAITPNLAADWRQALVKSGLSTAAVKTHCGNVKTVFNEALRRKIISENPFSELVSGATPATNQRYVSPTEADAIVEACGDMRLKLVFALARYAGLRTPSETHLLTWSDVDWQHNRLRVRSPKTERHSGHEQRTVPICPKLAKILQDAYDSAPDGAEQIVTLGMGGYFRTGMRRAIRRAGVAEWSSLWQTLRRSCEIEWAQIYPQFAVSKWIGHSITVSGKHYANLVPDELFDKVATSVPQAAQNAAQQGAKSREINAQAGEGALRGPREISAKYASLRVGAPPFKAEAEGFEPPDDLRRLRFSRPVQ